MEAASSMHGACNKQLKSCIKSCYGILADVSIIALSLALMKEGGHVVRVSDVKALLRVLEEERGELGMSNVHGYRPDELTQTLSQPVCTPQ